MQEKNSHNANLILIRLKSILNLRTDAALADYLGVKANTLSTWKTRNTVDYDLIVAKCDICDLNFIFRGEYVENKGKQPPGKCDNCAKKDLAIKNIENALKNTENALKTAQGEIELRKEMISLLNDKINYMAGENSKQENDVRDGQKRKTA